jgi:prepilin-type N-terminal cleavage/methylation domain-containing protein
MRRGFTLIELLVGLGLVALLVLGSMNLLVGSLRSLQTTTTDVTMTDQTSRTLRKIAENVRSAVSVTITNGTTLTYNLPALASTADPVTGEREVAIPPTSDGVNRGYRVNFSDGTVTDLQTGKVLVRNVCSIDPDPQSTLYNQAYVPFQLVTIGSYKGVTINIIARDTSSRMVRTIRMKTTTILKNTQ